MDVLNRDQGGGGGERAHTGDGHQALGWFIGVVPEESFDFPFGGF